ncbi:hypothetical protein [Streptomyces vilmorinianum]|uniref:hypothetical protein n=1 Tax=Streptomyces vilmorinianum TaxID=3051092 RepID=UPI001C2F891B|nr:hypothetical protein [Streptomyces vilmorinianum]
MAKGGARARSGPAPDPNALRRERDAGEWTVLPVAGRTGAPPAWPLSDQTAREKKLWTSLWAKPQGLMWERYGQELEVALYVRRFTEAELMDSRVNLSTLVRQMADSLGLTTPGMRANRWRIDRSENGDERRPAPTGRPASGGRVSARDRLKVIGGGG